MAQCGKWFETTQGWPLSDETRQGATAAAGHSQTVRHAMRTPVHLRYLNPCRKRNFLENEYLKRKTL